LYLHGYESSCLEGKYLLNEFLNLNIAVAYIDFSPCGLSEGTYATLSYYESLDTDYIIGRIKEIYNINYFIL